MLAFLLVYLVYEVNSRCTSLLSIRNSPIRTFDLSNPDALHFLIPKFPAVIRAA